MHHPHRGILDDPQQAEAGRVDELPTAPREGGFVGLSHTYALLLSPVSWHLGRNKGVKQDRVCPSVSETEKDKGAG